MTSTTRAARYGVIGYPVSHSLSPAMFGAAFAALSLRATYTAVAIPPHALAKGVAGLVSSGYRGFNVTVPHKTAILPILARTDPTVRAIGAANAVSVTDRGLEGFNTDVEGFLESLSPLGVPDLRGGTILLLGAGGAARAVVFALAAAGADRVLVANRSARKAEQLAHALAGPCPGLAVEAVGMGRLAALPGLADCRLCVQATSLGLGPDDPLPIDPAHLPADCFVYDLVYGPDGTALVRRARALGRAAADGSEMLLRQAMAAFTIWFGLPAPEDAMRRALGTAIRSRGPLDKNPIGQ